MLHIEPRKHQDNSQKQHGLAATENVVDSINAYVKWGKKREKIIGRTQVKKLALNLALSPIPNTSSSQEKEILNSDEVVYGGPSTNIIRPKRRKWKLLARNASIKGHSK